MTAAVLICAMTCLVMILSVLFFPKLRFGKFSVSTYWIVTLVGAVVLLLSGLGDVRSVLSALAENSAVNPLKILVLFLSMTVLSVFLDELGFFRFLASLALRRARGGQKPLFYLLYLTVSVLTIFTSNDVIILSFTPFILYFAENANVDPAPYLTAEFVAANTWSTALIIGNPTNVYLATACGIDFVSYLELSLVPTLFAGIVSLVMLRLVYAKKLAAPIAVLPLSAEIKDKVLLRIGLVHLVVCTVLLAIGNYVGLEMWLVALCAAGSLFVCVLFVSVLRRRKPETLKGCLKRVPYELVPFVLSMFVMIVVLEEKGVTEALARLFGETGLVLKYGCASFLFSNLINNIPMSVLFSAVLGSAQGPEVLGATFATIVGSNLGALFTPVGALAGIMWSGILGRHGLKFGYLDFLKMGVTVALPALFAALGGLLLVLP